MFPRTEDELARAGYVYLNTWKCMGATCETMIAWYRTPNGEHIPLEEATLEPHSVRCPDVNKFRKAKT
jgi:hypothetical protein